MKCDICMQRIERGVDGGGELEGEMESWVAVYIHTHIRAFSLSQLAKIENKCHYE